MGREGPSPVPPFLLPDSRNADRRAGVGTATFLGRAKHPVRQIMLPHFTNEETDQELMIGPKSKQKISSKTRFESRYDSKVYVPIPH